MTKRKTGPHKPSGQPTKYDPKKNSDVTAFMMMGATIPEVAKFLNVHPETVSEWIKIHPRFSDAVKAGRELADARVAKSMYVSALKGNVAAQTNWLANRRPKDWRERKEVEVKGSIELTDRLDAARSRVASE